MRISDWSSDVCSSDLGGLLGALGALQHLLRIVLAAARFRADLPPQLPRNPQQQQAARQQQADDLEKLGGEGGERDPRSEERRVGKEGGNTGRSRRWSYH